jgi:hypothetical protein
MELKGQIAIVTGAGRGIGRAIALELARQGADIVIAEMDQAGAKRTAEEVGALGRRSLAVATDVTSRADLRAMVDRAKAEFGRIDILINNAGIYRAASTLDVTEDHWDAIMNINAKAVFFATQAVLPTMIAQKRGAIVSLASMAGKIGSRLRLVTGHQCYGKLLVDIRHAVVEDGDPVAGSQILFGHARVHLLDIDGLKIGEGRRGRQWSRRRNRSCLDGRSVIDYGPTVEPTTSEPADRGAEASAA